MSSSRVHALYRDHNCADNIIVQQKVVELNQLELQSANSITRVRGVVTENELTNRVDSFNQ